MEVWGPRRGWSLLASVHNPLRKQHAHRLCRVLLVSRKPRILGRELPNSGIIGGGALGAQLRFCLSHATVHGAVQDG